MGEPSIFEPNLSRNLFGNGKVLCFEIDIICYQGESSSHDGSPGFWIELIRSLIRLPQWVLQFLHQPFILSLSDGWQVSSLRSGRSFFVEKNRNPPPAQCSSEFTGNADCLSHLHSLN